MQSLDNMPRVKSPCTTCKAVPWNQRSALGSNTNEQEESGQVTAIKFVLNEVNDGQPINDAVIN